MIGYTRTRVGDAQKPRRRCLDVSVVSGTARI